MRENYKPIYILLNVYKCVVSHQVILSDRKCQFCFFPNVKYLVLGSNSLESDLLSELEDFKCNSGTPLPARHSAVERDREQAGSNLTVECGTSHTDRNSCQLRGAGNIVSISWLDLNVGVVVDGLSEFHIP